MSWHRETYTDGCYARRESELTDAEKAHGLRDVVTARNFTQLMDRTDEQDRLEAEYREGRVTAP